MKRHLLAIVGVMGIAAGVWAAIAGTSPNVHPPVAGDFPAAKNIHAFWTDHPDWRLFAEPRIDTTPLRFEHAVHMNAATPQMQQRIKAWVEQLRAQGVPDDKIPVTVTRDRTSEHLGGHQTLALSCVACHAPDDTGRYIQPVAFNNHCVQCHTLGSRNGEPVPHGSGIAAYLDRVALKNAATSKEPPKATSASGPKRRGPGGASGGGKEESAKPVTFESEAAMLQAIQATASAERDKLVRSIKANCNKCHGLDALIDHIPDPAIPDRWLPRAGFDHHAHRFMDCLTCHAQAAPGAAKGEISGGKYHDQDNPQSPAYLMRWTGRTRDIMVPGLTNCLACHRPAHVTTAPGIPSIPGAPRTPRDPGAKAACVDCHIYHGK